MTTEQETTMQTCKAEPKIEYETVTINVPKPIMAFLRFQAELEGFSGVEKIVEWHFLDSVRAELEGFAGEDLIKALGIDVIFYDILGDDLYKPDTDNTETEREAEKPKEK